MNKQITELVNLLHSVRTQELKEKKLEAFINSIRQKAYYDALKRAMRAKKEDLPYLEYI